jgi:hypothetical protein
MRNRITNEKSNHKFQIRFLRRHLSNAYDIYGEFHFRIYRVEIRPRSTLVVTKKYKVRKFGDYFQDFGDTQGSLSGFEYASKYTLRFVFGATSSIVTRLHLGLQFSVSYFEYRDSTPFRTLVLCVILRVS